MRTLLILGTLAAALAGAHAQAATTFTGTGPSSFNGTIGNTTASGSSGTVGSANGGFAAFHANGTANAFVSPSYSMSNHTLNLTGFTTPGDTLATGTGRSNASTLFGATFTGTGFGSFTSN